MVREDAKVKDAVFAMTQAKSGSTAIVSKDGTLAGIFTDGDLRRLITQKAGLLDMPIAGVMTRNPVCIRADQLAADALAIFEEHNIDDLVVVDAQNKLAGAVDIQDLPKLKIM
jgi:arabinose-5-phosphate isomerase